jgi:predicted DNA-binding protein
MPTKQPRLNVVLEPYLYQTITFLAKEEGISLSLKARDLLKEAVEAHEDLVLSRKASERAKTFKSKKAPTLSEVRRKLGHA